MVSATRQGMMMTHGKAWEAAKVFNNREGNASRPISLSQAGLEGPSTPDPTSAFHCP